MIRPASSYMRSLLFIRTEVKGGVRGGGGKYRLGIQYKVYRRSLAHLHVGATVARHQLHPERRTLDERHRRHVVARPSTEEQRQHRADQPHVVVLAIAKQVIETARVRGAESRGEDGERLVIGETVKALNRKIFTR